MGNRLLVVIIVPIREKAIKKIPPPEAGGFDIIQQPQPQPPLPLLPQP